MLFFIAKWSRLAGVSPSSSLLLPPPPSSPPPRPILSLRASADADSNMLALFLGLCVSAAADKE